MATWSVTLDLFSTNDDSQALCTDAFTVIARDERSAIARASARARDEMPHYDDRTDPLLRVRDVNNLDVPAAPSPDKRRTACAP